MLAGIDDKRKCPVTEGLSEPYLLQAQKACHDNNVCEAHLSESEQGRSVPRLGRVGSVGSLRHETKEINKRKVLASVQLFLATANVRANQGFSERPAHHRRAGPRASIRQNREFSEPPAHHPRASPSSKWSQYAGPWLSGCLSKLVSLKRAGGLS